MNRMNWLHGKKWSIGEDKDGDCFIIVQESDGLWRGMSSLVGQGVHFATRNSAVEAADGRYNQVKGTGTDAPVPRLEPIDFKLQ